MYILDTLLPDDYDSEEMASPDIKGSIVRKRAFYMSVFKHVLRKSNCKIVKKKQRRSTHVAYSDSFFTIIEKKSKDRDIKGNSTKPAANR